MWITVRIKEFLTEFLPLPNRGNCKNFATAVALAEVCSLCFSIDINSSRQQTNVVSLFHYYLSLKLHGDVAKKMHKHKRRDFSEKREYFHDTVCAESFFAYVIYRQSCARYYL